MRTQPGRHLTRIPTKIKPFDKSPVHAIINKKIKQSKRYEGTCSTHNNPERDASGGSVLLGSRCYQPGAALIRPGICPPLAAVVLQEGFF